MRLLFCLLLTLAVLSCHDNKTPDVSNQKITLETHRFETDLFSLDTTQFAMQLDQLIRKYPSFGENFLTTILNTDPRWTQDSVANYVRGFISAYRPVYDTSKIVFPDFTSYEEQIKKGLQYVKYYFPSYKAPKKVITYIGPLDGYGDILSEDAFIVGLHHHLGKDFSLYHSIFVSEVYPAYITNRFEPDYIVINCMKNVINDLYPEKAEEKTLIVQMVEKGKRLYLLSKFLPSAKEHMLIGYTEKQFQESMEHEKTIWNFFIQNDLLQNMDNSVIVNYIGESPKTNELGESSPGNIGSFVGWQIVKKYMNENPSVTPEQLMETDVEKLIAKTKYKP